MRHKRPLKLGKKPAAVTASRLARKNDKNRIRRRFRTHFFGPGPDFGRFGGPGWEAKFMKNAFEDASEKKLKKKHKDAQTCAGSASCAGSAGR